MSSPESKSRKAASHRLHAMDSFAELIVTTGGFIVLAAVLGICLYLVWVVVPLFAKGDVRDGADGYAKDISQIREVLLDPYSQSATVVDREYNLTTFLTRQGQVVGSGVASEEGHIPSAMSFARNGEFFAIGYESGHFQIGSLTYTTSMVTTEEKHDDGEQNEAHSSKTHGQSHGQSHEPRWLDARISGVDNGYVENLGGTRGRQVVFESDLDSPVLLKEGEGAVKLIDYRQDPTGKKIVVALREDGTVLVNKVRVTRPLGGGTPRVRVQTKSFKLNAPENLPDHLQIAADGNHVFAIWKNGLCERYAKVQSGDFGLVESFNLVEEHVAITEIRMLLGGQTILVGQGDGTVKAFHVAEDKRNRHADGMQIVRSHQFRSSSGPVVSITPSTRDRSIVILRDSGIVELIHLTSEKQVVHYQSGIENPIYALMAPKNNGVFVLGSDGQFSFREIEPGYPEFSVSGLFGRVYYEGVEEPEYVYQSSSGDDASEIKLSLMPLIFGTLKATVFAMIFAIPIGILAAIYSSEFVSKRVRRKIKPTVELMASLPSVVLGFVAAMVVAPFAAKYLDSFVIGLVILPIVILLGAHIWQLIPLAYRLRTRTGHHLALVALVVLAGVGMSHLMGPMIVKGWFSPDSFDAAILAGDYEVVPAEELPSWAHNAGYNIRTVRRLRNSEMLVDGDEVLRAGNTSNDHSEVLAELNLSDGDLQRWLNNEYGTGHAGWMVVFFPVACILVWVLQALFIRRQIDLRISTMSGFAGSIVILAKFVVLLSASIALSYVFASLVQGFGFDPRDSIFGSFSPRNTLIVSIIMGFAVIPIIYTISEDSLQAVPMTLRTASLGAGATPWQTATRVVLPVAASGMFSACMIGFGRAVGETMIVLMATGNTPEMDWNIFAGFRTLAANIAVELPEAPKDETHYRVLFLCGLVLFVMTFIINTMAELVRRVVRARNAGL